MQIYQIINSASQKLKNNNIHSCRLDSEILLSKVLNKKRQDLLLNSNYKSNQVLIEVRKRLKLKKKVLNPRTQRLHELDTIKDDFIYV